MDRRINFYVEKKLPNGHIEVDGSFGVGSTVKIRGKVYTITSVDSETRGRVGYSCVEIISVYCKKR